MGERFYFAWVDQDTAFNPAAHNVEDEDVFSFVLSQEEGDFAALSIEIKNPRVGLLATGRKVWMWLSFTDDDGATITPLFLGRLIGIPDNVFGEIVTLKFTARPADFADQKYALAQSLKVAPYWEPIFVAPDSWDDPDAVLEGYTVLWHIDPVTHAVTVSDILTGEDGVVEYQPDEFFYDSLAITLNTVPLRSVSMIATIPWTISGIGSFDLAPYIVKYWPSNIAKANIAPQLIDSFTMDGLISDWPKAGSGIGVGWDVVSGSLEDMSFLAVPQMKIPDYFTDGLPSALPEGSVAYPPLISSKIWAGVDGAGFDTNVDQIYAPVGYGKPTLQITYTANRTMAEVVTFTLNTNMQAIMTLPDQDESLVLNLSGNSVSDIVVDAIAIEDVRNRFFAQSARGQQAVQHLILVARANLVARSRAVSISFQTDFKSGLPVTLRKGGLIHDDRIPGGQATGKIVGYELSLDGSSGAALATIKMASAIGYGGAHTPEEGTPVYATPGYMAKGYQAYDGAVELIGTNDIAYSMPPQAYFDDGVDLKALNVDNAIEEFFVTNSALTQRASLQDAPPYDQSQISARLQTIPTLVNLRLVPMEGGPFRGIVSVGVSDLIIPKQIDLEAPSV